LTSLVQLLLLSTGGAHAHGEDGPGCDQRNFSFGVRGGIAFAQHTGIEERDSEYDVHSEWRIGLTGGVFIHWPITSRFGLQQELLYTQKGSSQKIDVEILEIPTTLDVTYEADYIELPLLMKLTTFEWRRGSLYSLMGTGLSLKVQDHYELSGEVDDGEEVVPLRADADMSEVEMFDYSFVYGTGYEHDFGSHRLLIEYRFTIGWNTLYMPTYAYVPFGDDEEILIENEPVPLKNQTHSITLGIRF
jgi:hypothetical protein